MHEKKAFSAKWPTRVPKTKLILCPRDPQGYQFEPVRQDFERVPEHHVSFDMRYSMGFAKSHSLSAHYTNGRDAAQQESQLV